MAVAQGLDLVCNKDLFLGAVRATLGLKYLNVSAKISTASPSIISYAG
ncbi:hypothetical protein [Pedobacter sp. N23S346]